MLIVFPLWFKAQLDVMINNWFGSFYNIVQQALAKPGAVTQEQFFGQLATFGGIAMVYIMTAVSGYREVAVLESSRLT